jgi:dienelactone hydrolase
MAKGPIGERVHLEDEPGCLVPGRGVVMHRYRPPVAGPRSRAGVVVLPIQGGNYEVSTMLAEWLARRGYQTLRFERRGEWLDPERPIERLPDLVRQFEADVRRGYEWWLAQPDGPRRLGLMGVSMGGIVGSVLSARDERIRGTVLVIAGGDLPSILVTGRDTELDAWRAAVARRMGTTEPGLLPHFRAALDPVDNLGRVGGRDPATTLFLAARFDRVIRWRHSVALWEALGRPRRRVLPCGHYSTVLFLPYVRGAALRWFDRHVLGGTDAPAEAGADGGHADGEANGGVSAREAS